MSGVSADDTDYLRSLGVFPASRSALIFVRSGFFLVLLSLGFGLLEEFWQVWNREALYTSSCSVSSNSIFQYQYCGFYMLDRVSTVFQRFPWLTLWPGDSALPIVLFFEYLLSPTQSYSLSQLFLDQGVGVLVIPALAVSLVTLVLTLLITRFTLRFQRRSPYVNDFGDGYRMVRLGFIWGFCALFLYWWFSRVIPIGFSMIQESFSPNELNWSGYQKLIQFMGLGLVGIGVVTQFVAVLGFRLRYAKLISTIRQNYGK